MQRNTKLNGEMIRKWRTSEGITQQELASSLGIGVATVARWEAGDAKPTGTALVILEGLILGENLQTAYKIYKLLKLALKE